MGVTGVMAEQLRLVIVITMPPNGAADKPRAFRINADRREAIYAEAQTASSAG
jgi:hypothetical protein